MPTLCADCGATEVASSKCRRCGSSRVLAHDELFNLSMLHVDCDAFYASVEKRDRPELAAKPVIIGGGRRGVVATACYNARVFGVRSAMPLYQAKKLCPQAVVISPDMEKYRSVSRQVRHFMDRLSPLVEPLSIDEAFIDMTGTEKLHGMSPAQSAVHFANTIRKEIGITISIGLSHNKFLAKIASDLDKPSGFSIIGRHETEAFLKDKPVNIIWGVGKAFEEKLRAHGIKKIKDIWNWDETSLMKTFGTMGNRLWRLSHGQDVRAVETDNKAKSISSETTFEFDQADYQTLEDVLWQQCETVSYQLKRKDLMGKGVTLKLKPSIHKSITRAQKLPDATQLAHRIFDVAKTLLKKEANGTPYRLLGVGVTDLIPYGTESETDLADPNRHQKNQAERAIDSLNQKFGKATVKKGRGFKAK